MQKVFFGFIIGIPIFISILIGSRINNVNLDFVDSVIHNYEKRNHDFFTDSKNVQTAHELLENNIDSLTAVLSMYKPLDQLIEILPSLMYTYSHALKLKPVLDTQNFQDILNSNDFAEIQNLLLELGDLLNKTEYILASNQANIKKLPTLQPFSSLNLAFRFLKTHNQDIFNTVSRANNFVSILNNSLGLSKPHTILLLIQNNNEIRATGGFIGLLGFLEVDNAQIKSLEFRDIYDFDGSFEGLSNVPIEFQDDNQKLFIRDFNFSPDFPAVATQIEKFLQQSKAPSFETIVSINHNVFSQLGPFIDEVKINNNTYKFSKDLDFILSFLVESKAHGDSSSKNKISEMLSSLPNKILQSASPEKLVKFLLSQIESRNIQVYSKNTTLDKALSDLDFRQDLSHLEPFAQMHTFNSVSGTKGDRFIDRHMTFLHTFNDTHVTTEVTINLEHTYTDQTEWLLNSLLKSYDLNPMRGDIRYILGRGDYQAFIRSYLPEGSKLIDSDLKFFEVADPYNSRQNQVAGFGITPDKITRFSFTYQTPISYKINSATSFKFENLFQSGLNNTQITHIVDLENINLHAFSPKNYKLKNNRLINTQSFTSDYKAEFLISPQQ